MRAVKILCVAALLGLCSIMLRFDPVSAEGGTFQIYLRETITLAYQPLEAFFLVEIPGEEAKRVKAVFVPLYAEESAVPSVPAQWVFGTKINIPPEAATIDYSLIIGGRDQQYSFIPPRTIPSRLPAVKDARTPGEAIDEARERLQKRKEVLKSWQLQMKAQDQSLSRLRADADVIADLGRIVEVRDEIERAKQERRYLDQDVENLQQFIKLARVYPAPKSFLPRENQLTKQITELAEAAKSAERSESGRRSHSERDIQYKLSVIEAARKEDYDTLQREAIRLRKQRLELERTGAAAAPARPAQDEDEDPSEYLQ